MTKLQDIVNNFDIMDYNQMQLALENCNDVSDGEINWTLSFDLASQSKEFKNMAALANALAAKRNLAEQKRLTYITAFSGAFGAIIGAGISLLATYLSN